MLYSTLYAAMFLSQLESKFVNGYRYPRPIKMRQLQTQTLNYRATYRADFQHLLDPSCVGEPPIIGIQCDGANMTILSTSDPLIDCTKLEDPSIIGTVYACGAVCSGDACVGLYSASNASTFFDGPFGSVTFMCEGDEYRNVSTTFVYLGENTTCDSSAVATQTRNYHAGRLGVDCRVGSSREYVFDDAYFECNSFEPPVNTKASSADAYTCVSGNDCRGEECNVTIKQITFSSDVPKFFDDCVDKLTTATSASPTSAPAISRFQFTAQFEAKWAVLYDSDDALASCTNAHGGAIASCDNGSYIKYLSSSDTSMMCTQLNDHELSCIGSEGGISNQFTQVNYECTGPTTPTTRVTFLQSDVVCALVQETVTINHTVALGVVCSVDTLYFDIYTECASASHQFYAGEGEFDFSNEFFICSESASFSLGTSTTPQIIPNVTIRTDNYWLIIPDGSCLNTVTATQSPVSSAPVSVPTILPTMVASMDVAPVIPRVNPPTSTSQSTSIPINQSTNNDDNGGISGTLIGMVIGCVGAGFLLTALIGYFVFFRKRNANVTTTKTILSNADISSTDNQDITDFSSPTQSLPTDANPVVPMSHTALVSAPLDTRGATFPTHFVPEWKDQCRDVVMPPNQVSSKNQTKRIAGAMANDTLIVNASGVRLVSEAPSSSKEPPGRQFLDM